MSSAKPSPKMTRLRSSSITKVNDSVNHAATPLKTPSKSTTASVATPAKTSKTPSKSTAVAKTPSKNATPAKKATKTKPTVDEQKNDVKSNGTQKIEDATVAAKTVEHPKSESEPKEKSVSFIEEEKSTEVEVTSEIKVSKEPVAVKANPDQIPKNLDSNHALIIKGLNFKTNVVDIKKKLPTSEWVRMPMKSSKPDENIGYCIVYFKSREDCDAAYIIMRKNSKINGRSSFTRYFAYDVEEQTSQNAVIRSQVDKKQLFVRGAQLFKRISHEAFRNAFPKATFIYHLNSKHNSFAIVTFANESDAAEALKNVPTINDSALSVTYARQSPANKDTAPKSKKAPQQEPPAKKQKIEFAKKEDKIETNSSADDSEIDEEDNSSGETSESDVGGLIDDEAVSTDSADEINSDEGSE